MASFVGVVVVVGVAALLGVDVVGVASFVGVVIVGVAALVGVVLVVGVHYVVADVHRPRGCEFDPKLFLGRHGPSPTSSLFIFGLFK